MSKPFQFLQIPYLLLFLFLSLWAVRQPHYSWDLLGYIGCAADSTNAEDIHHAAFDAIKNARSDEGLQVDNPYRADVAANPYHFAEQLPFYSIKPLYVGLLQLLHRVGLPFEKAAAAISAASNFLLAFLLWQWLSAYLGGWATAACCTLIMLSPNVLALSRWTTPDCFATVTAAGALYLLLERKAYFWGSSLLIIDIWVRTDALVLAGLVFAVLLLSRKLDLVQFVSLCVLALASYFTINHFAGNYGWPALFYNSFLGGLAAPGETVIHLPRSAYLHQVIRGVFVWLVEGSFALYLLLGGLAIRLNRSAGSMYPRMVVTVLLARVVSYLLYPNGDQRYTAVLFVLIPTALVIAIAANKLPGAMPPASQENTTADVTPARAAQMMGVG